MSVITDTPTDRTVVYATLELPEHGTDEQRILAAAEAIEDAIKDIRREAMIWVVDRIAMRRQ